jgi:hypothetical protein
MESYKKASRTLVWSKGWLGMIRFQAQVVLAIVSFLWTVRMRDSVPYWQLAVGSLFHPTWSFSVWPCLSSKAARCLLARWVAPLYNVFTGLTAHQLSWILLVRSKFQALPTHSRRIMEGVNIGYWNLGGHLTFSLLICPKCNWLYWQMYQIIF